VSSHCNLYLEDQRGEISRGKFGHMVQQKDDNKKLTLKYVRAK